MLAENTVWTESDVRFRLRIWNDDDTLYDCRIARPSQIYISHTSGSDPMPGRAEKLLSRAEVSRAIEGTLWIVGPLDTKAKRRRRQMYHMLRLIYFYDRGIDGAAQVTMIPHSTVQDLEADAVSIITMYLNGQQTRAGRELTNIRS